MGLQTMLEFQVAISHILATDQTWVDKRKCIITAWGKKKQNSSKCKSHWWQLNSFIFIHIIVMHALM